MNRSQKTIVYATTTILTVVLIHLYRVRGGPYFAMPATVQDHLWRGDQPLRDGIILMRRAEKDIPAGAEVTILVPSQGPDYHHTLFMTALGVMANHNVVAPVLPGDGRETLPDYVIAFREPLEHPAYILLKEYPEGKLYFVNR